MRPTRIMAITAGVLAALGGIGLFVWLLFLRRPGGEFWFYWIPVLLIGGFAGLMINLAVGYWMKVGRLEARGRPRE